MGGGEPVRAQREAFDEDGRLPVVADDVERHLEGAGRDHAQRGVIRARDPIARIGSGPDETFEEGPVIVRAAAAGEQDGVGIVVLEAAVIAWVFQFERLDLRVGEGVAPRVESRRGGDVDVRRPEVWLGLVDVDVLGRRSAKRHVLGLGPVEEVGRCGARHPADAVSGGAEIAEVGLFARRPEADVLRVEGAVGDQGALGRLVPMHAVRGNESEQTVGAAAAQRFEAFGRRHAGAGVEERREVVGDALGLDQDHVVLARAGDLVEAEAGPCPMDAIRAFGAAGDFAALGRAVAAGGRGASAVVHEIARAILDHRDVGADDAFPRLVQAESGPGRHRVMQAQIEAVEPFDEEPVDHQLAPGAEVNRVLGDGDTSGGQEQAGQQHPARSHQIRSDSQALPGSWFGSGLRRRGLWRGGSR